jgi:hypothetical protein
MEPVWILRRCYRMTPGPACLTLGVFYSAGSAISHIQHREGIPPDAWKQTAPREGAWHADGRLYEYQLESYMLPVDPPPPPPSIELGRAD